MDFFGAQSNNHFAREQLLFEQVIKDTFRSSMIEMWETVDVNLDTSQLGV